LIVELSIATVPTIPVDPLSASNISNHTPCRLHRLKRLQIVVQGPYAEGQSRQRAPERRM